MLKNSVFSHFFSSKRTKSDKLLVHTEITLKNVEDKFKAKIGLIPAQEIRQMTVTALVDTGAWTLVINEATRKELGLDYDGKSPGTLGACRTCGILR